MKVVMTRVELDNHVKNYDKNVERDDSLVHRDTKSPTGWSVYVRMNHWDILLPIHVEEK